MVGEYTVAPRIECSACGYDLTVKNEEDIKLGTRMVCPGCGGTLVLASHEIIRHWCWKNIGVLR